ncbi:hypothetical protein ACFQH5_17995 [Halomonas salifodinae]|uniref:Uncharacterized protein n=1 Tax=Halomonas salifodinae TaxID=438745 RepID=A0ABW2F2U5_9GAMM
MMTVRVVSADDETIGVRSTIIRRVGGDVGADYTYYTDENGEVEVPADCQNTFFKPYGYSPLYSRTLAWVPCRDDPTIISLIPVAFAPVVQSAIDADLSVFVASRPEISDYQEQFSTALEVGNTPDVAYSANEIAATLRQVGETELAEAFSVTAMASGWQTIDISLHLSHTVGGGEYIAVDPGQRSWRMTPEGQDVLFLFQEKAGIRQTGVWDWQTFKALQAEEVER